jgi:hypothetical protein
VIWISLVQSGTSSFCFFFLLCVAERTLRQVSNVELHPRDLFSRQQPESEYDWLVMTSVFVASQSSGFFLCWREKIRPVENSLEA